jgi:predicted nucleic acid-binding protein
VGQGAALTRPILLDTDILVDFLRGHDKAVTFVTAHSDRIVLSAVVLAELYSGVKGDAEKAVLDSFVALFPVAPVTAEIARAGGLYRRDYGKTHGVGLADAILVATAEAEGAELATLSVKHYPMVKGLRPAYRKAARRSSST